MKTQLVTGRIVPVSPSGEEKFTDRNPGAIVFSTSPIGSDPATGTPINIRDILLKLITDPATQTTLAEVLAELITLNNTGIKEIINALPTGSNVIGKVVTVDDDGEEKFTEDNPGIVRAAVEDILSQPIKAMPKTVTSTAAELFTGIGPLEGRAKLIVVNTGNETVYYGDGSVTPETGLPLFPYDSVVLILPKMYHNISLHLRM